MDVMGMRRAAQCPDELLTIVQARISGEQRGAVMRGKRLGFVQRFRSGMQEPVTERDRPHALHTLSIRPAVYQGGQHVFDGLPFCRAPVQVVKTGDATHRYAELSASFEPRGIGQGCIPVR
ncbi:MAG: hypothetical protein D6746_01200 [Bacteroidetes bacterium]|nr:MAG: hypothetical protein D6746_01200 [Bacteroidota bacterium]